MMPLIASRLRRGFTAGLLALLGAWPAILPAQADGGDSASGAGRIAPTVQPAPRPGTDSVLVVAGARYRAGPVRSYLLGRDYRDLWTTPVRVPVLDLDRFAGGLEVVKRGGGMQTASLRLRGADGREYTFRSVDKAPHLAEHPDLRGTPVGATIRDQTSALNPAAALIAAPLLDAAGVLHAEPRLFVMPDDPRLGEFRTEFAGMLGLVEVRPDEGEDDAPGFASSKRVVSTERMLERIEEKKDERVDSRAYLTARLVDLLLNDWDRHADQWRWAQFERNGYEVFVPIPRDRDYALVDYEGAALDVARLALPLAIRFDERYPRLQGLLMSAAPLDRPLLAELSRATWDSVVAEVRTRLTDSVIAAAAHRLPPEFYAQRGAEITRILQARRERLPEVAAEFYEQLAKVPTVYATDEPELALVDRLPDGRVRVRVAPRGTDIDREPRYDRVFRPDETIEIRLYLQGGDDRVRVRGTAERSIPVRVLGGGGDDDYADSSRVRGAGGRVAFYDDRGDNTFVTGPRTTVDREPYEPPTTRRTLSGAQAPDWGSSRSIAPWATLRGPVGLIVGAEYGVTRYAFRQDPYASRWSFRGEYAPKPSGFAVDFEGDLRPGQTGTAWLLHARASGLDALRFYGFGNDTPDLADDDEAFVERTRVVVEPAVSWLLAPPVRLQVGPVFEYNDPKVPSGSPLQREQPLGTAAFSQAGGRAELLLDTRDHAAFPRQGVRATIGGTVYPDVLDARGIFGEAHTTVATYLPVAVPPGSSVALRIGGKQVWGDFPFYEAAFLGGRRTLRGYPTDRFAGDAMLFGNAELRARLARAKLLVRGDLGAIALGDVGRVWSDGDTSDAWHTSVGGGLWFSILDRAATASLIYARGGDDRLYLRLGMPF